jgi:hypothetical protein
LATSIAATLVAVPGGRAQPSQPLPPYKTFAPFFKVNQGFSTSLFVRNNHTSVAATATPVVFAMDGQQFRLGAIQLQPNVRTLDLKQAMTQSGVQLDSGAIALEFVGAHPTSVTGTQSGAPDEEGNYIPAGVTFGSARAEHADGRRKANLAIVGAMYDPVAGMCGEFYLPCLGVLFPQILADPTEGFVGQSSGVDFWAHWSDGTVSHENWQASFSSSDPSVIAIYGGGGVDFLQVGDASLEGSASLPQDTLDPYFCPLFLFLIFVGGGSNPSVSIIGGLPFAFVGSDPTIPRLIQQAQGTPAGGTYAWTASPTNRVSFDNPTSQEPRLSGINPSTSVGDTTITVRYTFSGRSATTTRAITSCIFKFIQQRVATQVDFDGPVVFGYQKTPFYNVYTSPTQQLLEPGFPDIRVTEVLEILESNFPAPLIQGSGATDGNSEFSDLLKLTDSAPLPANVQIVLRQDLFVGGFFVRNNTLTFGPTTVTITNNGPFN